MYIQYNPLIRRNNQIQCRVNIQVQDWVQSTWVLNNQDINYYQAGSNELNG